MQTCFAALTALKANEKAGVAVAMQTGLEPTRNRNIIPHAKKVLTSVKLMLLWDNLEPVVVGQPGHKELFPGIILYVSFVSN